MKKPVNKFAALLRVAAALAVIGQVAGCAGVHHSASTPATTRGYASLPEDHVLGDPGAPVVLIQYDAPTCPHCAATLGDSFPHLKSDYIDTGKVFYVYRVFPLNRVDVQVESVARCLPRERYFPFMAMVLRRQSEWDPEASAKDARGGLALIAHDAGLSDDAFDRCFADAATLDRIEQEGVAAGKPFGLNGAPTFVINGEVVVGNQGWPFLRERIEAALTRRS